MNVNADDAAVAVAKTLDAELILLSDVSGVLDADKNLIASLDKTSAEQLITAGVITDGMIVKVKAALDAANDLGRAIEVAGWRNPELLSQVFAGNSIGTRFLPEA
jgi:acetylglutamate kinase